MEFWWIFFFLEFAFHSFIISVSLWKVPISSLIDYIFLLVLRAAWGWFLLTTFFLDFESDFPIFLCLVILDFLDIVDGTL